MLTHIIMRALLKGPNSNKPIYMAWSNNNKMEWVIKTNKL